MGSYRDNHDNLTHGEILLTTETVYRNNYRSVVVQGRQLWAVPATLAFTVPSTENSPIRTTMCQRKRRDGRQAVGHCQ